MLIPATGFLLNLLFYESYAALNCVEIVPSEVLSRNSHLKSRYLILYQTSLSTILLLLSFSALRTKPLLTNLVYSSGRFRGGGKNGGAKSPGPPNGAQPTSPTGTPQSGQSSTSLAPRMPPLPSSPSLSQTLSMDDSTGSLPSNDALSVYNLANPKPLWLNDAYAKHIVKGNFMTLSARPKTVEQGEWIAHQGEFFS